MTVTPTTASRFAPRAVAALSALGVAATMTLASAPAEARYGRNGAFFGGLAAGALVGGLVAGSHGAYGHGHGYGHGYGYAPVIYDHGPVCHYRTRKVWNSYGELVWRTVKVCR